MRARARYRSTVVRGGGNTMGTDAMIQRLLLEHPRAVGESYFAHMAASLRTAARLAVAAGACLVHAVVPGVCTTTGSSAIIKLHGEIYPRRFDQPTL